MTMETIFLIVLAAFNVWTIYFYNKLLLEVANGKEKEKKNAYRPDGTCRQKSFQSVPTAEERRNGTKTNRIHVRIG